jgi:hypothetical protein
MAAKGGAVTVTARATADTGAARPVSDAAPAASHCGHLDRPGPMVPPLQANQLQSTRMEQTLIRTHCERQSLILTLLLCACAEAPSSADPGELLSRYAHEGTADAGFCLLVEVVCAAPEFKQTVEWSRCQSRI